jgi:hypothetical protein
MARTKAKNVLGGDTEREQHDRYLTKQPLALAICRKLRDDAGIDPAIIVEPSAGAGSFVRAAREAWGTKPEITAVEAVRAPNFAELEASGANRVIFSKWEDADDAIPRSLDYDQTILVVGNPPFDTAEDRTRRNALPMKRRGEVPTTAEAHVALALRRLNHHRERQAVDRFVAFLLPVSFLGGKARVDRLFLATSGLRFFWPLDDRPSFTDDGGTMMTEYAVFVWQAGYRGRWEGDHLRTRVTT